MTFLFRLWRQKPETTAANAQVKTSIQLPTREQVVAEAIAAGLSPARAQQAADVEVECGLASDDSDDGSYRP